MNETDRITVLSAPERIRRRPAVCFGSDGPEGVCAMIRYVLDLFADEARAGHCPAISVTRQGDVITVAGRDRGLFLGGPEDDAVWRRVFCEFPLIPRGGPPAGAAFSYFQPPKDDFFGWSELHMAQCASRFMDVETVREEVRSELRFREGLPVGGIARSRAEQPSGTTLRFAPDPRVFTSTAIPAEFIPALLAGYERDIPGLTCRWEDLT